MRSALIGMALALGAAADAPAAGIAVVSEPLAGPEWVAGDLTWVSSENRFEKLVRAEPGGQVVTSEMPPPGPVEGLQVRAASTRAVLGSGTHVAVVRDVYACYPPAPGEDTTSCVYVPEVLAAPARGALRRVWVGSPCDVTDADRFALGGDTLAVAAPADPCRAPAAIRRRWRLVALDLRSPEPAAHVFARPLAERVRLRAADRQISWSTSSSRISSAGGRALSAPRHIRLGRGFRRLADWAIQGDGTVVLGTWLHGWRVSLALAGPRASHPKRLGATAAGHSTQVAGDRIAVTRRRGVALVDFRGRATDARVPGLPRPRSFTDFDGRNLAWTHTEVLERPTRCPDNGSAPCTPSPGRTRTTVYGGPLGRMH